MKREFIGLTPSDHHHYYDQMQGFLTVSVFRYSIDMDMEVFDSSVYGFARIVSFKPALDMRVSHHVRIS